MDTPPPLPSSPIPTTIPASPFRSNSIRTTTTHSSSSTSSPSTNNEKLRIVLVGAGIGGLSLALMLEKTNDPNIDYIILEKGTSIMTAGTALTLNPTTTAIFEQLGILNDILEISTPLAKFNFYNDKLKSIGNMDFSMPNATSGMLTISRPDLYELLRTKVPSQKIHYSKRVLSIQQSPTKQDLVNDPTDTKASVKCSDGTTIKQVDMIIACDGAYSAVRQSLYSWLKSQGRLPVADQQPLTFSKRCVIGVATPKDPENYELFKEEKCHFRMVLSTSKHTKFSYAVVPLRGNRLAWTVAEHVEKSLDSTGDFFRATRWGPEVSEKMLSEARSLPCPEGATGKTMGDLMDLTDPELISMVMLEENFFETWYGGRTCLMGDAAHKMLPSGGQGANMAIMDAVVLANLIRQHPKQPTVEQTRGLFKRFRDSRIQACKSAMKGTEGMNAIFDNKGMMANLFRKVVFNMIPTSAFTKSLSKAALDSPILDYLPKPVICLMAEELKSNAKNKVKDLGRPEINARVSMSLKDGRRDQDGIQSFSTSTLGTVRTVKSENSGRIKIPDPAPLAATAPVVL